MRYPLVWDEFEDNVRFVSENANFLQFNLVASNLTSHKLYETCTWMKQFSNAINISILSDPRSMTERAVPLEHRKIYIENIETGEVVFEYNLLEKIQNKKTHIYFDSKSLGDNIAWIPAVEEFRKKYNVKNIKCATFLN